MTDKPKVLTLREAADVLDMKPPNVRKFLERRGIEPAFEKSYGAFWHETDIRRAKNEREADEERLAADRQRRRSALRRRAQSNGTPALRLGARQRALLKEMSYRNLRAETDAARLALRRLNDRGLVARGDDGWGLTDAGRKAAGQL